MSVTLGYWDLRGLGEPIRFLLKYLDIPFKDVRYELKGDKYADNTWVPVKFTLGLDFPNIPYLMDGNVKLTHRRAIMKYLGRKHGLEGQTETENTRIDMIENHMEDLRKNGLAHVVYSPLLDATKFDFETLKAEYISKLSTYMSQISNFLGTNQWMAGDRLTYVDFWVYEVLDWNRLFKSDCLNDYKNLQQYMDRFEALPKIKEYINSDQFNRFPLFAPMAKWGGQPYPD